MANFRSPQDDVRSSGFRVQSSKFRVQSSKFRVQSSGFRVQGSKGVLSFKNNPARATYLNAGCFPSAVRVYAPTTHCSAIPYVLELSFYELEILGLNAALNWAIRQR
ncbi:hypothetical protein BH09BAC3_BH09BAC3_33380 [soil metagenome]